MFEDSLSFDTLEPKVVPVTIGSDRYELHEASAGSSIAYTNAMLSARRVMPDGSTQTTNLANADLTYLSCNLFKVTPKELVNVTIDELRTWPKQIYTKLLRKLEQISESNSADPPERASLEAALSVEGSPVAYDDLEVWINGLVGKEFLPIQELLSNNSERAKNAQKGTATVSS